MEMVTFIEQLADRHQLFYHRKRLPLIMVNIEIFASVESKMENISISITNLKCFNAKSCVSFIRHKLYIHASVFHSYHGTSMEILRDRT